MNAKTREALRTALGDDLPDGFRLALGDDFINVRPKLSEKDIRAVRVIGDGRMLMLFQYDTSNVGWSYRRTSYTVHYLNEHNELVEFEPDAAQAAWRKAHGKPHNFGIGWDRAVGWWLEQEGARQFKGRGWAADCAMKILNLVTRWERHYSDGIPLEIIA